MVIPETITEPHSVAAGQRKVTEQSQATVASTVTVPILHINDVYRVQAQKLVRGIVIDVTQFAHLVDTLRSAWPERSGGTGERDGIVCFSGDLFSPSVESSITRGSHMVRL